MRHKIFSILLIIALAGTAAVASDHVGGNGLIYVNSARNISTGHLQLTAGTRFFGKIAGSGDAYTLWNVQGATALTMGVSKHIELTVSPIVYQDTNTEFGNRLDGQANVPDDIWVHVKAASFRGLESPWYFGGMLSLRIPTAESHNIVFEPYSAGGLEFGLTALMSYFSNATFLDEGWSFHANLSYLNHNDVDQEEELVPGVTLPNPINDLSSEILFGLGIRYPAGNFDFSTEVNGRAFLTKPSPQAYSKEFVSYLTGGVYYKPYRWLTFSLGIDLRLMAGSDETVYLPDMLNGDDFEVYPAWRGKLGFKLNLLPTSYFKTSEKSALERKAADRQEMLEKLMQGDKTPVKADDELKRVRTEREKVEAELQRLRKLLEEEKKKKKTE